MRKQRENVKQRGQGPFARIIANRGLIILGILMLVTIALANVKSWRHLPIVSIALPVGSPPTMPADSPSKEYIYAGSALIATAEPWLLKR